MVAQFVHTQTYARVAAMHRAGRHRGERASTNLDFVLAEAARTPEGSIHIAAPQPPGYLYGMDVQSFRALHDAALADTRVAVKGDRTRAVRTTQHTLCTVVLSHPALMEEVAVNEELQGAVGAWERDCVRWLQHRYGDQLKTVLRHTDEDHPHLHALILPGDPELRAAELHPGVIAKRQAVAEALEAGDESKMANRKGDRAYRAAMRAYQDDFYRSVGIQNGMARLGPQRKRMTRKEWLSHKGELALIQATLNRAGTRGARMVQKAESRANHAEQLAESLVAENAVLRAQLDAIRKTLTLG